MNNDNNNELINHLRERFTKNFITVNKLDITERVFLTKVVRTPNDDIILAINMVAEERMLMLEQSPSYIDINNISYTSAVTVNMYLNCARERKLKIEPPSPTPKKNDGLSTWKRKSILLDEDYHMCTL